MTIRWLVYRYREDESGRHEYHARGLSADSRWRWTPSQQGARTWRSRLDAERIARLRAAHVMEIRIGEPKR